MIKNIFENIVVKMVVMLSLVGALGGAALVFVYNYSMPRIKINIENETKSAIKSIFPGAGEVKKSVGGKEGFFEIMDPDGKPLGYAFLAEGNGYQGTIKLIVGVNPDFTKMEGFEVLESQETPGLGAEIAAPKFKDQFKGLDLSQEIEYIKNKRPEKPYEIEAITGATISSRAVVSTLNKSIEEARKELKGAK